MPVDAGEPAAAGRGRTGRHHRLVLLGDQDRSLWNREQIADGTALVEGALGSRRFGPYTLQAAEARKSYRRALELTHQASERRFLENRLAELEK
jgi:predicted RNA polymerase sigma factor